MHIIKANIEGIFHIIIQEDHDMKNGFSFPNRLALLRNQKGLTQEELANIISDIVNRKRGYSLLSVSGWETGDKQPTIEVLCVLCDYFNVTPNYLLGFEDDPGSSKIAPATVKTGKKGVIKPDYVITYNKLPNFDGEPIYVVFNELQSANRWGILNMSKERIVFGGDYITLRKDLNCTYYTNIPEDEKKPKYGVKKRLTVSQIRKSERVWVEPITPDKEIKGKYTGWFHNNENKSCLINAIGLTLPYDGLSISYNAYSGEA